MEEDKKITLQEAVSMASWTHKTNMNVLGFSPLQLMTGKNVVFPGITSGNEAMDSHYDDEVVRRIMECHFELMKEFREIELSRKLKKAKDTRAKGYENVKIKEGGLVYYQHQDKKAWLGPVKVFASRANENLFLQMKALGRFLDEMYSCVRLSWLQK